MNINLNTKLSRRVMATVLMLVAIFVAFPAMLTRVEHNAIINARVVTVYAPIEGTIGQLNKTPGDRVRSGERIATISNLRLNSSFVHQLEVERNSLQERVGGFNAHINELMN